ncbi:MAG TPA: AraC family transcriptional regulator, partial [Bryobacteraceae bacterium]|nr:AraC family transcriptional regulator [Bryobacteraceae bacterium]
SPERGLEAVGAMTVEARFDIPARSTRTGIRFRPGKAAPFLRVDSSELTGLTVSLEQLPGPPVRDLVSRLGEAKSPSDRARLLSHAIAPPDRDPNPVQRAIEAIAQAHGTIDLDWIARQCNLSPRHFRRRCLEESGLTPKVLCRILRFRHAASLARAKSRDWAAIAAEAGYFDQAHLIRDFREFTGRTPVAVFSNPEPAAIAYDEPYEDYARIDRPGDREIPALLGRPHRF